MQGVSTAWPRLAVLCAAGALAACAGGTTRDAAAGRIVVRGSDTMITLAERWAETYASATGIAVEVSGGGSGTGIAALANGTTDIATASRRMTPAERARIEHDRGPILERIVALDAVAIYVHLENPIPAMSLDEVARVYRGQTTRWRDLGGDDATIATYSRENSSGTYSFFKEEVLAWHDFAPATQCLPGTAAVVRAVARDRHAIGYGGIATSSAVRPMPIRAADGTLSRPTREEATSGRYPLARPLYVYLRAGAARPIGFVDWMLGADAQGLAEQAGFFPPGPGAPR